MNSRREMSFAQAEGREDLPTQLKPKEISPKLRSQLWRVLYDSFDQSIDYTRHVYPKQYFFVGLWKEILKDWWVDRCDYFVDDFTDDYSWWQDRLKTKFVAGDYIEIFDFLQFCVRHPFCPDSFPQAVEWALARSQAGYRLIDRTFVPIVDEADAYVAAEAFRRLNTVGLEGARAHLKLAAEGLSAGKWSDSIRESIHAVESALKIEVPGENVLSRALVRLEKDSQINPNLKRAINALYDYSSDEDGIRHARVFEDTKVAEPEAMYMFGVCAAFLTFLTMRDRSN